MLMPGSSNTSAPGRPSAKTRNDSRRLSDTSRKLMNCPSYHSKTMASESSCMRHGVIAFGAALAVVTSIDRVVLSLSRGRIAADLHLTDAGMGLVFSAYATAYAFCEIPSGHQGDRSGPSPVLMRIAIWCSSWPLPAERSILYRS